MISPPFIKAMAAYNREMNLRLYSAAARLTGEERRKDRGAFWRSIHGAFNHLLWAGRMWMSRFAGMQKPGIPLASSHEPIEDFATLQATRKRFDATICSWADSVDQAWLDRNQHWFSSALQRDPAAPGTLLIVHFFNHRTHRRGQVHALITAAVEKTGDTDLFQILAGLNA